MYKSKSAATWLALATLGRRAAATALPVCASARLGAGSWSAAAGTGPAGDADDGQDYDQHGILDLSAIRLCLAVDGSL